MVYRYCMPSRGEAKGMWYTLVSSYSVHAMHMCLGTCVFTEAALRYHLILVPWWVTNIRCWNRWSPNVFVLEKFITQFNPTRRLLCKSSVMFRFGHAFVQLRPSGWSVNWPNCFIPTITWKTGQSRTERNLHCHDKFYSTQYKNSIANYDKKTQSTSNLAYKCIGQCLRHDLVLGPWMIENRCDWWF